MSTKTKGKKTGKKAAKSARAGKSSRGSAASKGRASGRLSRTERVAAVRKRAKEVAGRIRAGATDLLSRMQKLAKKYRRR